MGIVIDYKCICGYKERIFEGAGFRAMNIELIAKYFPDEGKYISQHSEEAKPYLIKNVLGICDSCNKLCSITQLEYTKDGNKCEKTGRCPSCSKDIKIINNLRDVKCPHCDGTMKASHVGHWD